MSTRSLSPSLSETSLRLCSLDFFIFYVILIKVSKVVRKGRKGQVQVTPASRTVKERLERIRPPHLLSFLKLFGRWSSTHLKYPHNVVGKLRISVWLRSRFVLLAFLDRDKVSIIFQLDLSNTLKCSLKACLRLVSLELFHIFINTMR